MNSDSDDIDVSPLHMDTDHHRRRERTLAILAALACGEQRAEIAKRFGISAATVTKTAQRAGYISPYRRTRERAPEIVKAYTENMPIKKIVRIFEIDRKTLWNMVRAAGVPMRQKHHRVDLETIGL